MENLAKEFGTLSTNDPDSPQYISTVFCDTVTVNLSVLHMPAWKWRSHTGNRLMQTVHPTGPKTIANSIHVDASFTMAD
ncbi:hypothetical protein ACU8KH_03428 [Lachancea thermotolerans]